MFFYRLDIIDERMCVTRGVVCQAGSYKKKQERKRKEKVIIYMCNMQCVRGSVSTKSVRGGNPGLATIQTKGVRVVIVTILYAINDDGKRNG